MNKKTRKLLVGVAVVTAILILTIFLCTGDRPAILRELIKTHGENDEWEEIFDFGVGGMIALFVLSFLQVVLLCIPAEPIQVLSGISFGFGVGLLICFLGAILGNTLIYILYKIYGEKLDRFFTKRIHIDFESARHHGRVSLIVFILYIVPAIPYGMICLFASAMKMKYRQYIVVTSLGILPSIAIGVGLGYVAAEISWIVSISAFVFLAALMMCVCFLHRAV